MANTNFTPHPTLRPANMVEWLGVLTSTIADIKGIGWFDSNTLTIKGLCDAINNDPQFVTTITDAINLKLDASIYTPADILDKIKTVDGLNSGLDADTVRGYHPVDKAGDSMSGFLTLVGDPTDPLHAATKQYVDNLIQGLDVKQSVKVATTTNITLSGSQMIDSLTVVAEDRVLVKDQINAKANGIYIVKDGAWIRPLDMDDSHSITPGAFFFVEEGAVNADSGWVVVSDGEITVGTSTINFVQFSGAGQITPGVGLGKSGNMIYILDSGVTAGTYTKVTVNAQGQVVAATNPDTLSGYGITDAINVSEATTSATPNKLLYLNNEAKLPASITGNADGNAGSATKLQTARTFSISGDGTATVNFDGTTNANLALVLANTGVTAGTYTKVTVDSKGRVTSGTTLSASDIPVLDWSKITTGKPTTLEGYGITDAVNISEVVSTPTVNKILRLNAEAKLPASITGNADGNAATATKLETTRSFSISGDGTATVNFDGTSNANLALVLANTGVSAGTYTKVTVDTKGRVTSATTLSASDIPVLDWSKITTGKPTTLSGYGITDAVNIANTATVPTANKLLYLNASGLLPASITGDADSVDGFQGSDIVANKGSVSADWNTMVIPGMYRMLGTDWSSYTNGPSNAYQYGILLVLSSGTTVTQMYITHRSTVVSPTTAGSGIWVRSKFNASNWDPWYRLMGDQYDGIGSGFDSDLVDGRNVDDTKTDTTALWTAAKVIAQLALKVDNSNTVTIATANKLLYLDANAKLPASITGNADGNAATATKLQTARTIAISTDATGSTTFDGSGNVTIALTLANSGVTAGTYTKVTVDAKGRVTTGTSLSATDIPVLDWSKITTGKPTTLSGYGITDAVDKAGDTMTGFLVLNADPTLPMHAATKQYVDSVAQGLDVKQSVRVATTTNITLSGLQTIDGISLVNGDRVLVKDQTDATQNGIYIASSGSWSRSSDANTGGKMNGGTFFFIEDGTNYADTGWVVTTNSVITIGTSTISFTQFTGLGEITCGTGLSKSGSTIFISNTGVTAGTYTKVTVNAQGQVTSATTLSASDIPVLDWSKITTGKPTTLSGYGITDAINTANAAQTATANKLLYLDANAKLPASITGNADGNAATASKWQTARTLTLGGNVTGSVTIDGSANISLTVAVTDDSHNHSRLVKTDNRTVKPADTPKGYTSNYFTSLTGLNSSTIGSDYHDLLVFNNWVDTAGGKVNALAFDKNSMIIRHFQAAQGDTVWGTPKTLAYTSDNVSSASKLQTARAINITSDATGTASFDGSTDINIALTLANTGVTAGTYFKTTVDAKGRVTAGNNPTTLSGFGITDALNLAGGTMTGAISFAQGATSPPVSTAMAISYGRIQCFGPLAIVADTDASAPGNESIILAASVGLTPASSAGLKITSTSLTWKDNNVWHAGNDGAGSTLDADTVDGLQASQFLRSDQDASTSGNLNVGGITIGSKVSLLFNQPQNSLDIVFF